MSIGIEIVEEEKEIEFIDMFQGVVGQRSRFTPGIVNKIKELVEDHDMSEEYRRKLVTFTSVLKTGKYKLDQYIDAVHFVTNRISGMSQRAAYELVFPGKIAKWKSIGRDTHRISSNISTYAQTELVTRIYEQSMIPTHILNAGLFQQALNTAADIMLTSSSDMVRVQAINAILTNTKAPEVTKIELDVGVKQNSAIDELRKATQELAIEQARAIDAGIAVKTIAESVIVEADIEEV